MSNKKVLPFLILLLVAMFLAACSGQQAEDLATENADTVNAAATEAAEQLEAAQEEVEEAVEEVEEAVEEAEAEPTEEAMEEEVAEEPTEEAMEEEVAMEPCGPAADGALAGVDPRGQTVVWWHNHSGSREENLLPLIEQFNESNECGITVQAENQGGYNDIRDKVNASAAAGEQPAALVVGYQNDQAFYQLNQSLVDLNTYIDDAHWGLTAEERADFYPSFFDQSIHPVFDNQRLGFPPNRSMEVLYYNQTWLEELGFSGPPASPEEFRDMACAAAEANGDGTGGYILRDDASAVASWTYAFGGDVLSEDGTGYVYDGQATIDAMAFLKQLYDDGCAYFFTEGFPDPEFAARRAIFAQGSSSGIPFYAGGIATVAEEAGRAPDEWGVAAIPHTTADPVQNIYGGDVMITATTPEQQLAAWIFTKWFTSPEVQAEWDIISGYFPTRQSTNDFLGDYKTENPQWGQAVDMLPFSYYEPQLISYQSVRDAAQAAFNEIMQLPEGWTVDDITAILTELTATANELQEELMAELE
jgi:multiple sugar transport system substrate-binding protein/sn-glycerol 3-phosphate transport system substrate-binding protein